VLLNLDYQGQEDDIEPGDFCDCHNDIAFIGFTDVSLSVTTITHWRTNS
jgi:hypothetical protein